MYGTAGNRASPTWGRIKKELRCVSANYAKMNAFSAAVPQPRSASGGKLLIVVAEPPLPLRSLARYRRVPASGPGARTSRRVEGSAPRTKHAGGRHGQDRHVTLRCRRLPAHA